MEIPQVSHKRAPGEPTNIIHTCGLPTHTPFGNLSPKLHWIECRTEELNRRICDCYDLWRTAQDGSKLLQVENFDLVQRHKFACEYAVFQMRRIADELIGLHTVMAHFEENQDFPKSIRPASVGQLFAREYDIDKSIFAPHKRLLEALQNLSNMQKHSFVDTDTTLIGRNEPTAVGLDLKNNKVESGFVMRNYGLRDLVLEFDKFFKGVRTWLDSCSERTSASFSERK